MNKLSAATALLICRTLQNSTASYEEVARRCRASVRQVKDIGHGRSYTHLSKEFNFLPRED